MQSRLTTGAAIGLDAYAYEQLFNNVTAPILYKRVIVDDIWGFLAGVNVGVIPDATAQPAHKDIRSKHELLRLTRTLSIEYTSFGRPIRYSVLLAGDPAPGFIASDDDGEYIRQKALSYSSVYWWMVGVEGRGISPFAHDFFRAMAAFIILARHEAHGTPLLQLDKLLVCAHLGGMQDKWDMMQTPSDLDRHNKTLFAETLIRGTGVKHVCLRSSPGYLSFAYGYGLFPPSTAPSDRPDFSVHAHSSRYVPTFEVRSPTPFTTNDPFTRIGAA